MEVATLTLNAERHHRRGHLHRNPIGVPIKPRRSVCRLAGQAIAAATTRRADIRRVEFRDITGLPRRLALLLDHNDCGQMGPDLNSRNGCNMPGAYAHITLVNLAREPARLEAGPGMPGAASLALGRWLKCCELGSVSPDYPYLAIGAKGATKWADLMHYQRTGDMVKAGVEVVKGLRGNARDKAFAWLLGYTAHVITDATIHPVVELKVGPYAQNKTAHRRCEMHQDSYIYQRLDVGGVGVADYLKSGIEQCCVADGSIDPVIADTWRTMLERCHGSEFASNRPDIGRWHQGYIDVLNIGGQGCHLIPIARHVAVGCGLTYPLAQEVDHATYIDELKTPHGPLSYDKVFAKALEHVIQGWHLVGEAVFGTSNVYQTAFWDWNLDTGRDATNTLVLWVEDAA